MESHDKIHDDFCADIGSFHCANNNCACSSGSFSGPTESAIDACEASRNGLQYLDCIPADSIFIPATGDLCGNVGYVCVNYCPAGKFNSLCAAKSDSTNTYSCKIVTSTILKPSTGDECGCDNYFCSKNWDHWHFLADSLERSTSI